MIAPRTSATLLLLMAAWAAHLTHGQIHWNRGWGAGGTLGKRSYPRLYPHPWSASPQREWSGLLQVRHMRKAEPTQLRSLDKLAERNSHTADGKPGEYGEEGGNPPQSYMSQVGSVLDSLETDEGNPKKEKDVNERTRLGKEALDLSSVMLEGNEADSCAVDAGAISALFAQLVHAEALRILECRASIEQLGHQQAQGTN